MFVGWQVLASVVLQDLTLRTQQTAAVDRLRAAEGLRERWCWPTGCIRTQYRASELVALNDTPHPLFMPTCGKALAA